MVRDPERKEELEEVRSLLESISLLENVAAERESRVQEILGFLRTYGMTSEELADELGVSQESIHKLLTREEPKPPHERAGLSEQTIKDLDPLHSPNRP